jgi:predicted nucleotidyltransferase
MSEALSRTAERLGCSERTLRRYANDGLIRGRRLAGRGVELSRAEERYLASHWELLHGLRAALRTERAVRLAVLFGSTAVGEDERDSDVDVLIVHRGGAANALAGVRRRLARVVGRRVHAVALEQAEAMPTLLADVLDEGRVLIDRDGTWAHLRERRDEVRAAARDEEQATAARARAAVRAARERLARVA